MGLSDVTRFEASSARWKMKAATATCHRAATTALLQLDPAP
jgi:hypothetical protein